MSRLGGSDAYRPLDDGGAGFTSMSEDCCFCSTFFVTANSLVVSSCRSSVDFVLSVATDGGAGADDTA